ncbi:MAG: PRC-barrel domain-containing protein [Euryarchaeota archaeon]|nr:PRC-barrel domain-containing protein [Euryarchaeota archaeon]MBU4608428.1 PRC-barrel domain-containing protein [Euryarchaeota archaeon]MBV1755994.1 PRC-barrel domain-containing protein [Methanobacterium sp.]
MSKLDDDNDFDLVFDNNFRINSSISRINRKIESLSANQNIKSGTRIRINEKIIGKEVINNAGMMIGKVIDVVFDDDTREIKSIVIGPGGIAAGFKLSRSETIIPFKMVHQIGDNLVLKKGFNKV